MTGREFETVILIAAILWLLVLLAGGALWRWL
jgi:hypothetical protein